MTDAHTHPALHDATFVHLPAPMRKKRRQVRQARRQRWINRTATRLGLSPHLLGVCLESSLPVRKAYHSQN